MTHTGHALMAAGKICKESRLWMSSSIDSHERELYRRIIVWSGDGCLKLSFLEQASQKGMRQACLKAAQDWLGCDMG